MKNFFFLLLLMSTTTVTMAQKQRNLKPLNTKNMVKLDMLRGEATLKQGQKAYISYTVHASVGIYGEYEVADKTILAQETEHQQYKQKHKENMTGDDESTVTVVFHAIKKGETTVTVRNMMRGQVESEGEIKVTVE